MAPLARSFARWLAPRGLASAAPKSPRAVEDNVIKTKRRRAKVAREKGEPTGAAPPDDGARLMRCSAHAIAFDFDALQKFLRRSEHAVSTLPGVNDAIHIRLPPPPASAPAAADGSSACDAFVFECGALVCWGVPKAQEALLLEAVRPFSRSQPPAPASRSFFSRLWAARGASAPAAADAAAAAAAASAGAAPAGESLHSEEMDWIYRSDGNRNSDLRRDVIRVAPAEPAGGACAERLDRLAFSYALMQCVKLSAVEAMADSNLESMRGLSVRLARTGRVDFIGMDTLNQHIGRVMQLREFNLDSDIVETPDYFWEDSSREDMYAQLHRELEIGQRIGILNRKLSLTQESLESVNAVVVNAHATRLEANILYFVAFEACLSAAHLGGFLPEGGLARFLTQLLERNGLA